MSDRNFVQVGDVDVVTETLAAWRPLSEEALAARLEAEAEAVRARALAPKAIDFWLHTAGVGARQRATALREELIPPALRGWAADYPSSLSGVCALLAGPPGGGKTCASIWLLEQLYRRGSIDEEGRWDVPGSVFIGAAELFALCFARSAKDEKRSLRMLEEAPGLLVIDDWGLPFESAWVLAQLDRLIDRRWSELRATVVTTNLAPEPREGSNLLPEDSFARRYPRIYSRLCDSSGIGVITLVRADMRRERL